MKFGSAVFATLLGAAMFAGSTAFADTMGPRGCPPRPPDLAMDSKEGFSQSYGVLRCYGDNNRAGRSLERDFYIERLRRDQDRRSADREYRRRVEREESRRRWERDDDWRRADRDRYRRGRDRDDFWRGSDRDEYRRRRDSDFWDRLDRDDYDRRDYERDAYYERRLREDDAGQAIGIATEMLRRALSN